MLYELATLLLDRDWKRHQYVTDISALMFTAALAMITHTQNGNNSCPPADKYIRKWVCSVHNGISCSPKNHLVISIPRSIYRNDSRVQKGRDVLLDLSLT